jgi:RHS repeat-associated protein
MISMPHLPMIAWDYRDRMQAVTRQIVNGTGTPATTYYVYDASGERVRKVTERASSVDDMAAGLAPSRASEFLYFGGFEISRDYAGDGVTVSVERETLHVMDDKRRIALVETRTQGNDPGAAQMVRYQIGNHLDSALLELDTDARIISYEEYYPYGSTSYQAARSRTETPKRYRYTGKERDAESGLYYHGSRYYAPWLGRWMSADPAGLVDGTNQYKYTGNPVRFTDPGGTQPTDPLLTLGESRVVALGRSTINIPGFGELPFSEQVVTNAARATGLRPVTFGGLLSKYPAVRDTWKAVVGTGLPAGFRGLPSGQLLQGVLEGTTPVFMTTTGVDVLADTHTSSELRQLITHLGAGRNTGADIYFQEGEAVSRISRGSSVVEGAALPERIAQHLPPSFRTPPSSPPTGLPPAAVAGAEAESALAGTVSSAAGTESLLARTVSGLGRVLTPAAKFLGKVAGPLAAVGAVAQIATAQTEEQKVDAGISTVGAILANTPHPVARAAAAGVAVGQLLEKTLDVSDYASAHGVQAYEGLKSLGVNDTVSFAAGAVVTIGATPSAIVEAAADKGVKLAQRFWRWATN